MPPSNFAAADLARGREDALGPSLPGAENSMGHTRLESLSKYFLLFGATLAMGCLSSTSSEEPRNPQAPVLQPIPVKAPLSAGACETKARTLLARASDQAWATLLECSTRSDFEDLRKVTREPWIDLIRRNGIDGIRLLARVVGRHSYSEANVDVAILQDLGFMIHPPADLDRAGELRHRALVLTRGMILHRRRSDSYVQLQELAFDVPKECQISGVRWVQATRMNRCYEEGNSMAVKRALKRAWIPAQNGRDLLVDEPGETCKARDGEARVFLLRIDHVVADPIEDGGSDPAGFRGQVFASVVDCFGADYLQVYQPPPGRSK